MISVRWLPVSVFSAVLLTPLIHAQELSRYRDFQFGMNLLAVAKQTGMKPSDAKALHKHPALIQQLSWQTSLVGSSHQADPVRDIVFSFYNDELYRIVVTYDRYRAEGLTNEDMVEAISAKYGAATTPSAKITIVSFSQAYSDSEKVLARWEDTQYSFNLFRYTYQPTFGMVAFSKQLDSLAQAAIVEALRLDTQEAPQREKERKEKEEAASRAAQEKARFINKATIRP